MEAKMPFNFKVGFIALSVIVLVFIASNIGSVADGSRKFLGEAAGLFKETFFPNDAFTEVAEIPLDGARSADKKEDVGKKSFSAAFGTSAGENSCKFDSSATRVPEKVIFNEIAWMGTVAGFDKEWIELKNISDSAADISSFQIFDRDGQIKIIFPKETIIPVQGFYLLERSEEAVLKTKADVIYAGNLRNTDEALKLFDGDCNLIDEVLASPNWPAGDNKNKFTMERNTDGGGWHTSSVKEGTPRKENSPPLANFPSKESTSSATAENSAISSDDTQNSSSVSNLPTVSPNLRILISEVMAGTEENVDYDFVELYNPASQAADLTGWTIKKKSSSGKDYSLVAASRLEGKIIPPESYFLLVRGGWNGVSPDVEWPSSSSYALAYTNNAVYLYKATGELSDSASWQEIPKGSSWERVSFEESQFKVQPAPSPRSSK